AAGDADLGKHHGGGPPTVPPLSAQHLLPGHLPRAHRARREPARRRPARPARSQAGAADVMEKPVLDVQGLTIRLPRGADRLNAVESVSFAVAPGEIVCVVGESGSGKSVTAHAVMGLLPAGQLTATAGRVLLEGDDLLVKSPAEMRKIRGDRISMIFQ